MVPLDLSALAVGDPVQHPLLVLERTQKTTKAGDPFLTLTLGNATGRIEVEPIWSDRLDFAAGADKGCVVQAIGDVGIYERTGARQLKLRSPLRLLPDERAEEFLPRIADDPAKLWAWLDRTRNEVESGTLRGVLDLFFADEDFRYRFERTPGSVQGHHARLGGLLLHVYEVTHIARQTARTMRADVDLVVAGALLHDVGKVEAYEIASGVFAHTSCGLLLGHVTLGLLMLDRRHRACSTAPCTDGQLLDLQHMILAHHGKLEFGSPVEPMTAEAEIVHWADEASAKANDMLESIASDEGFADGAEFSSRRLWRVNRRVWRRPHGWE